MADIPWAAQENLATSLLCVRVLYNSKFDGAANPAPDSGAFANRTVDALSRASESKG